MTPVPTPRKPRQPPSAAASPQTVTAAAATAAAVTAAASAAGPAPPRAEFYPSFLTGAHTHGGPQQRWGSNLTPLALTTAMRNADVGFMTPFVDVLDELRETDPHLHAVLCKREWTVAGAEWELRPAAVYDGEGEPESARAVRTFCENALRGIPNLPDRISDLMGAVYYGRSVIEVVWRESQGYLWPVELLPVHPRAVQYGPGWRAYLYLDGDQTLPAPFGVWPGRPLDGMTPGKFIVHTPRVRGGYASKEGLGRPLAWYSMFKRWVVRDAMALAELAGRMARIGTYMTGTMGEKRASAEDVRALETTLRNWTSATSLVHPDTTKITLEKPVGGDTIHGPLFDVLNGEISKAVLGETLTTDAGSRGARSLGEVHANQGKMIARYDANSIAETLRRYLLAPLVAMNFGPHAAVPRLAFSVDPQESMNSLAERVAKLVPLGLEVSQAWVRDQLGIQDPNEGDKLLGVTLPVVTPSVAGDTVPIVWPARMSQPPIFSR